MKARSSKARETFGSVLQRRREFGKPPVCEAGSRLTTLYPDDRLADQINYRIGAAEILLIAAKAGRVGTAELHDSLFFWCVAGVIVSFDELSAENDMWLSLKAWPSLYSEARDLCGNPRWVGDSARRIALDICHDVNQAILIMMPDDAESLYLNNERMKRWRREINRQLKYRLAAVDGREFQVGIKKIIMDMMREQDTFSKRARCQELEAIAGRVEREGLTSKSLEWLEELMFYDRSSAWLGESTIGIYNDSESSQTVAEAVFARLNGSKMPAGERKKVEWFVEGTMRLAARFRGSESFSRAAMARDDDANLEATRTMTLREIGDALGCSDETAKVRLGKSLKTIGRQTHIVSMSNCPDAYRAQLQNYLRSHTTKSVKAPEKQR